VLDRADARREGAWGIGMDERGWLPKLGYYLDESDPDVVVLRRQDGSFVAAFSAGGHERGHRGGRQRGLPSARIASARGRGEGIIFG
jgi:hypothetical protein